MTRAEALPKIAKLGPIAVATGITLTDNDANIGPAIDAALREMGVEEEDIATANVDSSSVPAFLALIEYHALDLMLARAVPHVDISGGSSGKAKKRSQLFEQIQKLKATAKERVRMFGFEGSDFILGSLNTSYIEPDAEGL